MLKQQVRSVMKSSLLNFSKKMKISQKDFRIKMKLDESLVNPICIAMDKTNELSRLDWNSILGMKSVFKTSITSVISVRLNTLSDANNIPKENVNVRFYLGANETPKLHLYNNGTPIMGIEIDDFV